LAVGSPIGISVDAVIARGAQGSGIVGTVVWSVSPRLRPGPGELSKTGVVRAHSAVRYHVRTALGVTARGKCQIVIVASAAKGAAIANLTLPRVETAVVDVFAVNEAVTIPIEPIPTSDVVNIYLDAG
jgi:hypothetical protein